MACKARSPIGKAKMLQVRVTAYWVRINLAMRALEYVDRDFRGLL